MMSRKEMAELRAREIYQEAARLLCEKGYDRASIRDIAEATGLTNAGLYYYFKSKEELLFIILDGYMEKLLEGAAKILRNVPDPEERLLTLIRFQVDMYCKDVHRSKLIVHDENCLSGDWYDIIKNKQREYLSFWKKTLEEFAANIGKSIPHLSANVMILTGMCNWIYQWYNPRGPLKPEALATLIFEQFTRSLKQ